MFIKNVVSPPVGRTGFIGWTLCRDLLHFSGILKKIHNHA